MSQYFVKCHCFAYSSLKYFLNKTVKDYFESTDLRLVVTEKLKDLKKGKTGYKQSKEFRKTLSNWNYRALLDIIQKHCENNRVSFRSVAPYCTSQKCPSCGYTKRENRSNEDFKCLQCNFEEQADYVGSLNIRDRFINGRYGAVFKTETVTNVNLSNICYGIK